MTKIKEFGATMARLEPNEHETPLAFVERADAVNASDDEIDAVLMGHFGIDGENGDLKRLKLKSEVYWNKFFWERVKGIHERGGTKYAARKFIERKNGVCGQRVLTDKEIQELIESVGIWQR